MVKALVRNASTASSSWAQIRLTSLLEFGSLLGLRRGECAGLRVGRIDFLNRRLTVAERAIRIAHGRIHFGPPKAVAGRRTSASRPS